MKEEAKRTLPRALPGFAGVNRYWDRRLNIPAAKILPGECYVTNQGEMITTVLGSCISACVRDKVRNVGGMNHFMLPQQGGGGDEWGRSEVSASLRYGNWAMEYLINEVLKHGGQRRNLEVKVFGGGQVLSNMTNIGQGNINFVHAYLAREGLAIEAEDTGDIYPRKILYFPETGKVKLKKLRAVHNNTLQQREQAYSRSIEVAPVEGDIELF